jgi:hypothetical protein
MNISYTRINMEFLLELAIGSPLLYYIMQPKDYKCILQLLLITTPWHMTSLFQTQIQLKPDKDN